jgi:hypothetical protein
VGGLASYLLPPIKRKKRISQARRLRTARRAVLGAALVAALISPERGANAITPIDPQAIKLPVDSFSVLGNYTPPTGCTWLITSGYYNPGDGGGAIYQVVASDPGASYPSQTKKQLCGSGGAGTGKWAVLAIGSTINCKQIGVTASAVTNFSVTPATVTGTDDTSAVQACFQVAFNFGINIDFCENIVLNGQVNITSTSDGATFRGGQFYCSYTGSGPCFNIAMTTWYNPLSMTNIQWICTANNVSPPMTNTYGVINYTGSIANNGVTNTLTVSTTPSMPLKVGMWVTGPNVNNTAVPAITAQLTGPTGGAGTYTVSGPLQTAASSAMQATDATQGQGTFVGSNLVAKPLVQGDSHFNWTGPLKFINAWFGRINTMYYYGGSTIGVSSGGLWVDGASIGFTCEHCQVHACATCFNATGQTGQHYWACGAVACNVGYNTDPTTGTFAMTNSPWTTYIACHSSANVNGFNNNGTQGAQHQDCLIYNTFGTANFIAININNADNCNINNCQAALGAGISTFVYINNSNGVQVTNNILTAYSCLVNVNGTSFSCFAANNVPDYGATVGQTGWQAGIITNIAIAAGTATVTIGTSFPSNLNVGNGTSVVIFGTITNNVVNPLELNGTYTAGGSGAGTFTFPTSATGTFQSAGGSTGYVYVAGAGEAGQLIDNTAAKNNTLLSWRLRTGSVFSTNVSSSGSNAIPNSAAVAPVYFNNVTVNGLQATFAQYAVQNPADLSFVFVPPWASAVDINNTSVWTSATGGFRFTQISYFSFATQKTTGTPTQLCPATALPITGGTSTCLNQSGRLNVAGGDAFRIGAIQNATGGGTLVIQTSSRFTMRMLA